MAVNGYRIYVSDDTLADLNARLALTRFPDYFTEGDWDMRIHIPYIQDLVAYSRSEFD